jgi:hypothetical protein
VSALAIPAAVDNLVTLLRAIENLGAQVYDGPPTRDLDAADVLLIGGSPDGPHVTEDQEVRSLGARTVDENFSVQVSVITTSTESGEEVVKELRDRGFAILQRVADLLRANPTLQLAPAIQGPVIWALLAGPLSYTQVATEADGRWFLLETYIRCRARI